MKKFLWVLAAVGLATLTACSVKVASAKRASANPLIISAHFIGSEQLLASPDAARLKELWSQPSSAALRAHALTRFSLLPSYWLGDALPKGAAPQTNLFRPLLEDVLARESYIDATAAPDFVLATKLTEQRARVWETNLWQALANWKLGQPTALKTETGSGFELKRTGLPGTIRVQRAGDWVIVSAGTGRSAREAEWLANIKSTGRPAKPTGAWLDGSANLARFDTWMPGLASLENLPVAHFSFSNRADFVRTHAVLDFPKPHGWKSEPWLIPSNQIHDPLVSFLAVRGIAPLLQSFKPLAELDYKPTPNQIIGWGYAALPFQLNYAAPSRNVRSQLKPLTTELSETLLGSRGTNLAGQIVWDTNGQGVVWRGLPLAVPSLSELQDSGNEFLALSFFPRLRPTNSAPPGLYQAMAGRNDLVAFGFEMLPLRIPHWRQFYQLGEIATGRGLTTTNTPTQQWLIDLQSAPANRAQFAEGVTELRSTSPTQMTLMRKSMTGLSAFELVTLSRWLDSEKFPAFGVFPPPRAPRPNAARPRPR